MFVGRPPGNYDRLLDFSRAVTGTLFFVPSATFLESVNDDAPAAALHDPEPTLDSAPPRSASGGSLGVGCLKGENRYEPIFAGSSASTLTKGRWLPKSLWPAPGVTPFTGSQLGLPGPVFRPRGG